MTRKPSSPAKDAVTEDTLHHFVENQLKAGRPLDALLESVRLFSTSHGDPSPEYLSAHSRLMGHLGEFPEALRACSEAQRIARQTATGKRARIWEGVYWSRLDEYRRATALLTSPLPRQDMAFERVMQASHLLTVAVDSRDRQLLGLSDDMVDTVTSRLAPGSRELVELRAWTALLRTQLRTKARDLAALDDSVSALQALDDKSKMPHAYYRVGASFRAAGDYDQALQWYRKSRNLALSINSGYAFVRAALGELECRDTIGTKRSSMSVDELEQKLAVIAGQVGLGVIPTAFLRQLATRLSSAAKMRRQKLTWLVRERFLPDLSQMRDDTFELWCQTLIKLYPKEFVTLGRLSVTSTPKNEPAVDLIVRVPQVHQPAQIVGVQCKGGVSKWTPRKVDSELSLGAYAAANNQYRFDRFFWFTTAALSASTREAIRNKIAGMLWDTTLESRGRVMVFGKEDLEPYLVRNLELRYILTRPGQ